MIVRFRCPACRHKLKADSGLRGQRVRCTRCRAVVAVPMGLEVEAGHASGRDAVGADGSDHAPLDANRWRQPWHATWKRRHAIADDTGLDMTPMIDIVFQLLIFFMVTASFSVQKAMEMPQAEATEQSGPAPTIEELEQDESYVIVRVESDDTTWVDDALAPTRQELLYKLRSARSSGRGTAKRMLVLADGDARHELVVAALDAGTTVGMDEVRLATADDEF